MADSGLGPVGTPGRRRPTPRGAPGARAPVRPVLPSASPGKWWKLPLLLTGAWFVLGILVAAILFEVVWKGTMTEAEEDFRMEKLGKAWGLAMMFIWLPFIYKNWIRKQGSRGTPGRGEGT